MPRLFAGIELPADIRLRLSLVRGEVRGARWIDADDMHLTLRFMGEVTGRTADEIAARLAELECRSFSLMVAGVGSFGGRDPKVIWAGLQPGDPDGSRLSGLQRAVERAVRACGLEPEPRAFKPHVTLARLRGASVRSVARFLEENGDLRSPPFPVQRFVLFSARPGSGGGPYAVEEAFELGEANSE